MAGIIVVLALLLGVAFAGNHTGREQQKEIDKVQCEEKVK